MARSNKDAFVTILRDIARQVAALDADEFDDVMLGDAKIQVSVQGRRGSTASKPPVAAVPVEIEEIIQQLGEAKSREEGEALLDKVAATKDELTKLARALDVPVRKGDQVDLLRSRIIQATIGYRLSSAAIQGTTEPKSEAPMQVPAERSSESDTAPNSDSKEK